MSDLAIHIAERVREERELAGMSQDDLSAYTGIKRPNVARIERGNHMPTLYTLEIIAMTLAVPVSTFLEGAPQPEHD
jgi:Predicted transcription factor, homolog of eukaryotic MBF1